MLVKEFDTIARLETQSIDAYNDAHQYRSGATDIQDPGPRIYIDGCDGLRAFAGIPPVMTIKG